MCCFLQTIPSYKSLSSTLKKLEACIFDNICDFLFDFFPEDIDLGSLKVHDIEIFNQTTFYKKLAILAFKGAELAGGQILPPSPFMARNSEPHSRARVNACLTCCLSLYLYLLTMLTIVTDRYAKLIRHAEGIYTIVVYVNMKCISG